MKWGQSRRRAQPGRSVFVYRVGAGGALQDVISVMEPAWVHEHGLPTEAIVGTVPRGPEGGNSVTPEIFQENDAFVQFLELVIAAHVDRVPALVRHASRQGEGQIRVVDPRTPKPDGEVPPHDVLGSVTARGGSLLQGSYRHNPRHRLYTDDGFFLLPSEIENALLANISIRRNI